MLAMACISVAYFARLLFYCAFASSKILDPDLLVQFGCDSISGRIPTIGEKKKYCHH
jgi:hypothetical protein